MKRDMALSGSMRCEVSVGTDGMSLKDPRNVKTRNRSDGSRMLPADFWNISFHAVGHTITVFFATFGYTSLNSILIGLNPFVLVWTKCRHINGL